MTVITPVGATIPGVTHHVADVNGARLHYVSAGASGSPILLAHGWPESWWAFHKLIPLLAQSHRVVAVDLRDRSRLGEFVGVAIRVRHRGAAARARRQAAVDAVAVRIVGDDEDALFSTCGAGAKQRGRR